MRSLGRERALLIGICGMILGIAVVMVVSSLRSPDLPVFAPTVPAPAPVGSRLVGPTTYTVDAGAGDGWRFFDFSVGAEVTAPDGLGWDLAFRRFHVIANGGVGFSGTGGLRDLGAVPFDSVGRVPDSGYSPTEVQRDSINDGAARWYDYGFTTHVLTPRGHTYAVRTADGRYAKFEILSYYCPGARPGCVTFRYAYQGDGTTRVRRGIVP